MDIRIHDAGDLKRLNRQLRDVEDGKELRKELTGGLRAVLRPIASRVKAAYLAGPSRGRRRRSGPGLRSLLARATRVEVRTTGKLAGARLRVDGRKLPSGMRSLASMWEGPPEGKRWRHPVFGDRANWVAQGSHPTFYPTVGPVTDDALRAVDKVMEDVRRKLERG